MQLSGEIISGEFDPQLNAFSLQQIKHFTTETTLSENQFKQLYEYLKKYARDEDGHVLTLYDQMPIRLSPEEIEMLIQDLEKVGGMYS